MVTGAFHTLCQLVIIMLKMEGGVIGVGSEPRNGTGKGVTHEFVYQASVLN